MSKNEIVVLIHGFLASPWTLTYHEKHLQAAGFETLKWGYPSRQKTIQEHAKSLVHFLNQLPSNTPIHFVTHSMGGLILRAAVNHPDCPTLAKSGSAVLLTPPNQGVELGRMLSKWKVARLFCGENSGKELLTKENFDYLGEFPPSMKLKVIAGDLNYNPCLPSPSDSQVKVDETRLNTPHEHSILHNDHLFILLSRDASQQITEFLNGD